MFLFHTFKCQTKAQEVTPLQNTTAHLAAVMNRCTPGHRDITAGFDYRCNKKRRLQLGVVFIINQSPVSSIKRLVYKL